jgi:DNA-directed RNA polymerase specialized sigma24 family protein
VVARPQAWQLSRDAFSRLLAALSPDAEAAGARYEELRRALLRFFEWRGAREPEARADETFDRVARKIEEGEQIQDAVAYTRAVARLVLLEDAKRSRRRPVELLEHHAPAAAEPRDADADECAACLDRCLAGLPASSRELIVRYYDSAGGRTIDNRSRLASEMGIPQGALRNRAQRIRDRLEECVRACLRARAHDPSDAGL